MTDSIASVRLVGLKEVMSRVPLSRSSLYAMMADGSFPKAVKFSENRIAWDSREIDQWITEKLAAR